MSFEGRRKRNMYMTAASVLLALSVLACELTGAIEAIETPGGDTGDDGNGGGSMEVDPTIVPELTPVPTIAIDGSLPITLDDNPQTAIPSEATMTDGGLLRCSGSGLSITGKKSDGSPDTGFVGVGESLNTENFVFRVTKTADVVCEAVER